MRHLQQSLEVPDNLGDPSGTLWETVMMGFPDTLIVRRIERSVKTLSNAHDALEEAMVNITPARRRDRAFRAGEPCSSGH